jgi:hypothetical protein
MQQKIAFLNDQTKQQPQPIHAMFFWPNFEYLSPKLVNVNQHVTYFLTPLAEGL